MGYQRLLADSFIRSQLDIARELGVTRARVGQIMALLKLATEIIVNPMKEHDEEPFLYPHF